MSVEATRSYSVGRKDQVLSDWHLGKTNVYLIPEQMGLYDTAMCG